MNKPSFWEKTNNILGVITATFVAAAAWIVIWFTQQQHSARLDKLETVATQQGETLVRVEQKIDDIKNYWNIGAKQQADR